MTEVVERRKRGRIALTAPVLDALDLNQSDVSLERQVYTALRKSFMSGAVSPGARLSSRSLAAALGVSPTPIREALKRLESDGVLKSYQKSAYVVAELTDTEFKEALEIRLRLEGLLARHAAEKIDRNALTVIKRLHRQMTGMTVSGDWDHLLSLNYRWHFEIYKCAALPSALSLVENIWLRIGPALRKVQGEYADRHVYDHHQAIIDALEAADPDAAEAALRDDLLSAADSIEKLLAAPAK